MPNNKQTAEKREPKHNSNMVWPLCVFCSYSGVCIKERRITNVKKKHFKLMRRRSMMKSIGITCQTTNALCLCIVYASIQFDSCGNYIHSMCATNFWLPTNRNQRFLLRLHLMRSAHESKLNGPVSEKERDDLAIFTVHTPHWTPNEIIIFAFHKHNSFINCSADVTITNA